MNKLTITQQYSVSTVQAVLRQESTRRFDGWLAPDMLLSRPRGISVRHAVMNTNG